MDYTTITLQIRDAIATVTLNRPDKYNALTAQMRAELTHAMRHAPQEGARVVVMTGAGKAFCSGQDLGDEASAANADLERTLREEYQPLVLSITECPVPVIAAVNGPAVGAGCDLACMCDLRIAGESAWFAESFVKLGIIPGDGGAWLLQRVVGFSKAAEMALTGDRVKADQALACGLVSRVVPDDQLLDEARALAQRIAVNPTQAVRMTKRLLWAGRSLRLDALLEMSAAMQALAHSTSDHQEAVQAFIDKRAPDFTGD